MFQVAAEFSILDSPLAVIKRLQKTDHVQVVLMINGDKWTSWRIMVTMMIKTKGAITILTLV